MFFTAFLCFIFQLAFPLTPASAFPPDRAPIKIFVAPAAFQIVGGDKFFPKRILKAYYETHKGTKSFITTENLRNYIVDAVVYDFKREFPVGTVIDIGKKVNYKYLDIKDDATLQNLIEYSVETDKYGHAKDVVCMLNPSFSGELLSDSINYVLAIQKIEFTTRTDLKPDIGFGVNNFGISPGMSVTIGNHNPCLIVSFVIFDPFGNTVLTGSKEYSMPDFQHSNIFRYTLAAVHKINDAIFRLINK